MSAQPPKDWQLLLIVGVILLVDMCISVPLITLSILNDDFTPVADLDKKPTFNVSDIKKFSRLNEESSCYIFALFSAKEKGILENYYYLLL